MLDLYGKDAKITDIVDSYTWYILPVFNVDGYEYTWTKVSSLHMYHVATTYHFVFNFNCE